METLKKLLGAELNTQVEEKLGGIKVVLYGEGESVFIHKEDETPIITNNGEWIPKKKFNDLNAELKAERKLNSDNLAEIDTLKKSVGTNEELTTKITELQTKNEQFRTEAEANVLKVKKQYALKDSLVEAGAKSKNAELLITKFDFEKIEFGEDGKIKEFDKLLGPVKIEYKDLFGEVKLKGTDPLIPHGAPEGFISKEQFQNMTESERVQNVSKINESSKHWSNK